MAKFLISVKRRRFSRKTFAPRIIFRIENMYARVFDVLIITAIERQREVSVFQLLLMSTGLLSKCDGFGNLPCAG